ncbi:MAG: glycosyltransferase family 39 protein [bacterium]
MNASRLLLIFALLAGLGFRLCGLSHDLSDGFIYHPDTSKQINATQRFLKGEYYTHFGLSDYDGYPLFNSHLVEYIIRIARPVVDGVASLTGIPYDETWPDTVTIYWITRLLNVALATLLIWIVFLIGAENFDARTGLVAAWFLALSPVDMSSAHMETCDTTASFFAVVCVLFALRIYRLGRNIDYMAAAFFGMCALAAKYNAGMAMVAPVAAHVLRQKRWFEIFDAESIAQLVLFGVTAVAALFLTIPSMFVHPVIVPQEIIAFFKHVSAGKRLPEGVKEAGLWGRFLFSLDRNGPILVTILSPPLALVSLLGLWKVLRWNRIFLILYSLPVVYFLLGVSLRPLSHPIYHTMMTPVLFVICAAILVALFALHGPYRRSGVIAGVLLIASAYAFLLNESAEEGFYYWHRDTRRMAEAWTRENVPRSFLANNSRYSFDLGNYGDAAAGPHGVVYAGSDISGRKPRQGLFRLKTFALEHGSLPFFRNPEIGVHAWSGALRDGFQMPVFQRAPSRTGNEILFDGGAEFIRNGKILHVRERRVARRVLVATQELERAVIVIQNGVAPSAFSVSFAGRGEDLLLKSGEMRVMDFNDPCSGFPREEGRWFYRLAAKGFSGSARLTLATHPTAIAVALFNAGLYADAYPALVKAADATGNPTLAAQALIAALLAGTMPAPDEQAKLDRLTEPFRDGWTSDKMMDVYGIRPEYLQALSFYSYDAEALPYAGFDEVDERAATGGLVLKAAAGADGKGSAIGLPSLYLDPGSYQLSLDARPDSGGESVLNLSVLFQQGGFVTMDRERGGVISRAVRSFTLTNRCDFQASVIPFEIPFGAKEASILLRDKAGAGWSVDSIRIAPDPLATLNALGRTVGLLRGWESPADARDGVAYGPLIALGDRAAATGAVDRAAECYLAAAALCPEIAAPAERLSNLSDTLSPAAAAAAQAIVKEYNATRDDRPLREVSAVFEPGIRLEGFRVSTRRMHRNDTFGLNLYWSYDRADARAANLAVWVHVINSAGEVSFQCDRALAEDIARDPAMPELKPHFFEVKVPAKARLGTYRIQVGLCSADGRKRMKLESTELQTRREGVILPEEIRIVL